MTHQVDVKKMIALHERRLQLLQQKRAQSGLVVDPSVVHEIEDTQVKIEAFQADLYELEHSAVNGDIATMPDEAGQVETQIVIETERVLSKVQADIENWFFRSAKSSLDALDTLLPKLSEGNRDKLEGRANTLRKDLEEAIEVWDLYTDARASLQNGQPANQLEKLEEAQQLLDQVAEYPGTGQVVGAIQTAAKELSQGIFWGMAMIQGNMEDVERRLIMMLVINPQDEDLLNRLRPVQVANYLRKITGQIEHIQEQRVKNSSERQAQLQEHTEKVQREAKWWYVISLVAAAVSLGVLVFALAILLRLNNLFSYLTPLYALLPGILAAIFFSQYLRVNQWVRDERHRVWQQIQTGEQQSIKEIEVIRARLLKDIQRIETSSGLRSN